MNVHYIPRLMLRRFAENERVNLYQIREGHFATKKLKRVFSEEDLWDEQLEKVWDCADTGMEFLYPKLPGICMMDQGGILYKMNVLLELQEKKRREGLPEDLGREFQRLIWGTSVYSSNFGVYPLSPTRALVEFSPYFRAFFPVYDPTGKWEVYPPLLGKEQFDRHFYYPMRMELFSPCDNRFNQEYEYTVRKLTEEETLLVNCLQLSMETEAFVFHDFNRIRETFWHYEHRIEFAKGKKNRFCHII